MSSFGYYDTADNRYGSYNYPTYPSRTSSPMPDTGADSDRKLPPLSPGSSVAREERWNSTSYPVASSPGMSNASGPMRSPPASYSFTAYPTTNTAAGYTGYEMSMADVRNPVQAQSIHQTQASVLADTRSETSYGRPSSHSQLYSSPPISPTTSEQEPTIKKKRKRADAAQLKILNETYARTAFPSTEERQALAKELDMSARSVQIWRVTNLSLKPFIITM
jgi:homeobox protein YOX1/YHP1